MEGAFRLLDANGFANEISIHLASPLWPSLRFTDAGEPPIISSARVVAT